MSMKHVAQRLRTSRIDLRTLSDAYARAIVSERSESVRERFPVGSLAVKLNENESHTTNSAVVTSLGTLLDILLTPPGEGITEEWCLNATATLRDNGYPDVEVHWLDSGIFTLQIAGKWLRQPISEFVSVLMRPECIRIQLTDTEMKRISYQAFHNKDFATGKGSSEEILSAARLRQAGWPIRMDLDAIGHIDVEAMVAMSQSDDYSTDAHILESIYALVEEREADDRTWLFDPQPVLDRYLFRLWSVGVPAHILAAMSHRSYERMTAWLRSSQMYPSRIGMCPLSTALPLPVHVQPDPELVQRPVVMTQPAERFCDLELEAIQANSLRDESVQRILSGARARGIVVRDIIDAVFPGKAMGETKFRRYLRQLGVTLTDRWQYDTPTESERNAFLEGWSDHHDDFLSQTFLDVVNGAIPIQWIAKQVRTPVPKAWEALYFGHIRHTISIGEPIALDGQ